MNQERITPGREDFKTMMNWGTLMVRSLAVCGDVFLHVPSSFGQRYIGLQGVVVIPLVLLYSLFWKGHDVRPLLWFLPLYLAMCLFVRIGVAWRCRQGDQEHSLYNGRPYLSKLLPRWKETTIKGIVEPIILFVGGALILAANQALGSFIMLVGFGQMGLMKLIMGNEHMKAIDLNDAMLEQRNLVEVARKMRGEIF